MIETVQMRPPYLLRVAWPGTTHMGEFAPCETKTARARPRPLHPLVALSPLAVVHYSLRTHHSSRQRAAPTLITYSGLIMMTSADQATDTK